MKVSTHCILFLAISFAISGNCYAQSTTSKNAKPAGKQVNAQNNAQVTNNIQGAWWFTAILYSDGTTYELRNRQSGLELKESGQYSLNSWLGGANNMRTTGTYTVSGNQLRLKPNGGKQVNYTISFNADPPLMIMKSADGSGYKAERPKK